MAKPRSESRRGASSRSEPDAASLRRELYRPGADRDAVLAYLAAAEAERCADDGTAAAGSGPAAPDPAPTPEPAAEPPAPESEAQARLRSGWRRVALTAAVAIAVPAVGIALLPRAEPLPPRPTATSAPYAPAPATFDGLKGGDTLLVALPFRTKQVRVRLQCAGRRASYGWTALGEDPQTQQFIAVLEHSGTNCSPSATYTGQLPGDVSALRILIVVDGPYVVSVEPL